MQLRPYQESARAAVHREWLTVQSTLVVLPTGAGKTRVASAIIYDRRKSRSIFICHRQELVFQAASHIRKTTGLSVGIEMGEHKVSEGGLFAGCDVIVASVQTLTSGGDGLGRISKFSSDEFETVIADECHHAVSDSWKKAIEYFKQNKKCKILGLTATPDRTDEEALGQIFDTVAFDYEMWTNNPDEPSAIRDGWLVPVKVKTINCNGLDLSGVRTSMGELNGADLDAVMREEKPVQTWIQAILETMFSLDENSLLNIDTKEWSDFIGDRKFKRTLAFASSVAHAKMLCDILNRVRHGLSAFVSGKTDPEERIVLNREFAAGKFGVMCNCATHTEGFDDCGIEIVLPKPTKSRSLNTQMCGRATRPLDDIVNSLNSAGSAIVRRRIINKSDKPFFTIIDIHGNFGSHKLSSPLDILGGNISDDLVKDATDYFRKTGKSMMATDLIIDEEARVEQRKNREAQEFARKKKLVFKSPYKSSLTDPFDVFQIKPRVIRGWDKNKKLSEKQRDTFRNHIGDPDKFTYSDAKQLLDQQFEIWEKHLCTFKMIKALRKYGINGVGMDATVGHAYMDAIAKNGWRLPAGFVPPNILRKAPSRPSGQDLIDGDSVPF